MSQVALVFLLYDNVDVALQHLLIELSHENNYRNLLVQDAVMVKTSLDLISTWSSSKHEDTWQNKFIEALCIIQNYDILQKELGKVACVRLTNWL